MKLCYHFFAKLFCILILLAGWSSLAAFPFPPMELSSGYTAVIYQNVFSMEMGTALELAAATPLGNKLRFQLGYRQQFDKMRGEAFGRICAMGHLRRWQPEAGLELGITNRDNFTYDKQLLQEMQITS